MKSNMTDEQCGDEYMGVTEGVNEAVGEFLSTTFTNYDNNYLASIGSGEEIVITASPISNNQNTVHNSTNSSGKAEFSLIMIFLLFLRFWK
jgi:uncharacterized protein with LGFP repeats